MLLCFPVGCLKAWIMIGAIITVFISIGLLVVTIIINKQKSSILSDQDTDLTNKILAGMYASSILLLLMGVSGIYGSLKKNKFLLGLFTLGTFVFVIVFFTGMLLFFLGPKSIFDGTCSQPKNQFLIDLQNVSAIAQQTLCTDKCPCNFARQQQPLIDGFNSSTDSPYKRATDCPGFRDQADAGDIILMETLERQFDCGGWCSDNPTSQIYYFSDSSSLNFPSQACYESLKSFFSKYGNILGIGCSAAFGVALINVVMICCFCFHPSKARSKRRLFQNLIEDN